MTSTIPSGITRLSGAVHFDIAVLRGRREFLFLGDHRRHHRWGCDLDFGGNPGGARCSAEHRLPIDSGLLRGRRR